MEERPVLNLIQEICAALDEGGVAYCQWKGSATPERTARGDGDLDLLVSRIHAPRFIGILSRLGFKEAQAPADRQAPGVFHYYGYDSDADKIVHVHAYYQLVFGSELTDNYHLPLERPLLDSASQNHLFKVPTREFELIVSVIRTVLKFSSPTALLSHKSVVPAKVERELRYLQAHVDENHLRDTLGCYIPSIDPILFEDCLQSLQRDCPLLTRVNVWWRLHRSLRSHARRSQLSDINLGLWRRTTEIIRRRLLGRQPRKRMAYGGAIIAVIGGDGAGKSTSVAELCTWLSRNFATIKVHMGRPPRSWTTRLVEVILKIDRLRRIVPRRRQAAPLGASNTMTTVGGYPGLLRCVCTARDRYRAYTRAHTFATNGGLVICDRYPLPQLRLMDSPKGDRLIDLQQAGQFGHILARMEQMYYQRIMLPDVLIVLKVAPEIAVQRKTDEDPVSVELRSREIWELDWCQTKAHVIDAGRPKEDVLSEMKSVIWSQL